MSFTLHVVYMVLSSWKWNSSFCSVALSSPNFSSQKLLFIWEYIAGVKCLIGKGLVCLKNQIKFCFTILFQSHTNLLLRTLSNSWFYEILLITFHFEISISCERKLKSCPFPPQMWKIPEANKKEWEVTKEPTENTSSSWEVKQLDQVLWSWAGRPSKIPTVVFCTGCLCYMTSNLCSCVGSQKCLVSPRFLDLCSREPLNMALRLTRWVSDALIPKDLDTGLELINLGWNSELPQIQVEWVQYIWKYIPSNTGNSVVFVSSHSWNILLFSLNIGVQLLFICGVVNVSF